MLINILLMEAPFAEKLLLALVWIAALLPALTFHEWAHGYTAYKLGDSTAKADGRLSLNPLDHLDPYGVLMMVLIGFGWAKPVPINTRNFKKPKRDIALTSIAGPLANFVLAFFCVLFGVLFLNFALPRYGFTPTIEIIYTLLEYSAIINLGLGLFNLIPLPPLDGSNVLMSLLPPKMAMQYSKIRYYSHYIFLALIILSRLPGSLSPLSLLGDVRNAIYDGFWEISLRILSWFS